MDDKKLLLQVRDLKQYFPVSSGGFKKERLFVRANDGISLDIREGETFGLVGESGCGKSTFGRTILGLYQQTAGRTMYYGRSLEEIAPKYVEEIFKKLPEKKKHCEELRHKAAELKEKYESMKPGAEKNLTLESYNMADRDARNMLLDITSVVGGLYAADDTRLPEISRVYMDEYKATQRRKEAMNRLNILRADRGEKKSRLLEKGKTEDEIKSLLSADKAKEEGLEQEISACQKEVDKWAGEIKKLKKEFSNKPDFSLYESYMDNGINLASLTEKEMRGMRQDLQLIFQDPYSSLNPRMTVGQIIGEGLLAHNIFKKNDKEMQDYITQVMENCGLAPYFIHRYPHQFSGGQRQRIGIARSLAVHPKFVVCDEAVSALDVSIQSQIINLLLDLKEKENLTYLFISHDLSVVKYISDRIGVMYLGTMVELCETEELFAHPAHPYTEALLTAIPTTDIGGKKESIVLEGDIPSPIHPPAGCKFHTRCRHCTEICTQVTPEFEEITPGHFVACHHKQNIGNNK